MAHELRFQIKDKDIGARIGELEIDGKGIKTPAIMPVYNPNKPTIPIKDLKDKFGIRIVMTNSYILYKNSDLRNKVIENGIHRFLNFDGLIATDSGSYQLMRYGTVSVSNREIIEFQERIGSDIGSFLDIPTLPNAYKPRAIEQLELTLERAGGAENAKFVVNAGIQGSTFLDLRKKAAIEIGKRFRLCAIGGIVRLMEDYRFSDLVDIIVTVKKNLPTNRVVHAFGLGHPMSMGLVVALGCDIFDSAAYALYAQEFRYITEYGTKKLHDMEYLPCSCPVCNKYGVELKELPNEEKIRELARHNLYVTIEELNRIKEAIREGVLWELLSIRARSHPSLIEGINRVTRHNKFLSKLDPITKNSGFFVSGRESTQRTEVINTRVRAKRVTSKKLIMLRPFGNIPVEVLDIYPFNSFMCPELADKRKGISDIDIFRAILDYQFGSGASEIIDRISVKKSRNTGRMRWIYQGRELIASIRASDHFIIPKLPLAEKLKEKFPLPRLRVIIDKDAVPFVREGKSVFAKFVVDVDKDLRAGDEVLIVDQNDNLIRTGTLLLSPEEVKDFDYGVAVRVR